MTLYKDLRVGDTLISSDPEDDVWTYAARGWHEGWAEPLAITWLRHSTGRFEKVHFKSTQEVPPRYRIFRYEDE